MTEAQLARIALQFLARTDIKGAELRSAVAVVNWLEKLAANQPEPTEGLDNQQ